MKYGMKYGNFFLVAAAVLVLDQLSKLFVKKMVETGGDITVIGNFLMISYTTNTGAGFSIFSGMNMVLIWVAVIVIGALLYFSAIVKKGYLLPMAFILGGALGNLIDRIIYGNVVDFIAFSFWPVFNIADSMITVGAVYLAIIIMKEK